MTKQSESHISKLLIFLFYIFGFWPKTTSTPYYWIFSYIFNISFAILHLFSTFINILLLDDVGKITDSLTTTFTMIAYVAKILNFYYHRDNMKKCLGDLEAFPHYDLEEADITTSKHNFLNILGFGYFIGGNITIYLMFLKPIFDDDRGYPMPCWYPFEWKQNNVNYGFAYLHHCIAVLVGLWLNVAFDFYPCYLLGMTAAQFRIVGLRLRNLGYDAFIGGKHGSSKVSTFDNSTINKNVMDLRHCISSHLDILRLTTKIATIFEYVFFLQISLSGTIICCLIFQLTTLDLSSNDKLILSVEALLVKRVSYLFTEVFLILRSAISPLEDGVRYSYNSCCICLLTLQIFLYCYFGNDVLESSELLNFNAYSSKWYQLSLAYRKELMIFMERAKRSSQIVAGKIFPLDLMLFSTILNFAWRLYTLLRDNSQI